MLRQPRRDRLTQIKPRGHSSKPQARGWLYTTDRFWGVEWVEELHEGFSKRLFTLVGVHIVGVVFASGRHRENLVGAKLHGRKRAAAPDDVG